DYCVLPAVVLLGHLGCRQNGIVLRRREQRFGCALSRVHLEHRGGCPEGPGTSGAVRLVEAVPGADEIRGEALGPQAADAAARRYVVADQPSIAAPVVPERVRVIPPAADQQEVVLHPVMVATVITSFHIEGGYGSDAPVEGGRVDQVAGLL